LKIGIKFWPSYIKLYLARFYGTQCMCVCVRVRVCVCACVCAVYWEIESFWSCNRYEIEWWGTVVSIWRRHSLDSINSKFLQHVIWQKRANCSTTS